MFRRTMAKFATPIKLGTLVGQDITVFKVIWGKSRFGDYALLIRDKTDTLPAASTSNKVVLDMLKGMTPADFPKTFRVVEKESGATGYKYLTLE